MIHSERLESNQTHLFPRKTRNLIIPDVDFNKRIYTFSLNNWELDKLLCVKIEMSDPNLYFVWRSARFKTLSKLKLGWCGTHCFFNSSGSSKSLANVEFEGVTELAFNPIPALPFCNYLSSA